MNTDEPRLWDLARVVDGGESDRYHFGVDVRIKGGLMRLEEKTALDESTRVLQELEEGPLEQSPLYKRILAGGLPV